MGDLAGDPEYVVCSTDTNAKLLVAPTLDVNMDDYVKERVSRRATDRRPGEVIYYNWLKHYGWLRGRIVKKVNARKKTQQAQFSPFVQVDWDPCPSSTTRWTATAILNPAQYGQRARWFIVEA